MIEWPVSFLSNNKPENNFEKYLLLLANLNLSSFFFLLFFSFSFCIILLLPTRPSSSQSDIIFSQLLKLDIAKPCGIDMGTNFVKNMFG